MPFKSKAQQRYMFSQHPEIAKRWAKETSNMKNLPEKKKKKYQWGGISASNDPRLRGYDPGEQLPQDNPWISWNMQNDPGEQLPVDTPVPTPNVTPASVPNPQAKNKRRDPYFALRGATTGLGWLSGIVERNRQNQYMYNQYSSLGQADPANVNDYQPTNYNPYAQYGGIPVSNQEQIPAYQPQGQPIPQGWNQPAGYSGIENEKGADYAPTPKAMMDTWINYFINNGPESNIYRGKWQHHSFDPEKPVSPDVAQMGGQMAMSTYVKPPVQYNLNTKKPVLTQAELAALAHQFRGWKHPRNGEGAVSYVKEGDPILQKTAFLTPEESTAVNQYMNNAPWYQKLWEAMPNLAGKGDLPDNSTLKNRKKGGWIKDAVNPDHKGYCTPMTKSTCTPHRKAFARRAKAHFKEQGGRMKTYNC